MNYKLKHCFDMICHLSNEYLSFTCNDPILITIKEKLGAALVDKKPSVFPHHLLAYLVIIMTKKIKTSLEKCL